MTPKINAGRYRRVAGILGKSKYFANLLGPSDIAVERLTGEREMFSAEVVAVTHAIQLKGIDPKDADKGQILDIGEVVLKGDYRKLAVMPKEGASAPPEAESRAKPKAVKPSVAKPKLAKPRPRPAPPASPPAKPKVHARPSVKPAQRVEAPPVEPAVAAPAETAPPPAPPAPPAPPPPPPTPPPAPTPLPAAVAAIVPVTEKRPATTTAATEKTARRDVPSKDPNSVMVPRQAGYPPLEAPYCPFVALVSLCVAALQLAEVNDKMAGDKQRLKALEDLIREYSTFVVVRDPCA